jgi:hypothetical protein
VAGILRPKSRGKVLTEFRVEDLERAFERISNLEQKLSEQVCGDLSELDKKVILLEARSYENAKRVENLGVDINRCIADVLRVQTSLNLIREHIDSTVEKASANLTQLLAEHLVEEQKERTKVLVAIVSVLISVIATFVWDHLKH